MLSANLRSSARGAEDTPVELETNIPPLPDDLKDLENVPVVQNYDEAAVVGTQNPYESEIKDATKILFASPHGPNVRPYDVAKYFLGLAQGDLGRDVMKYAREWPVRANPVIHHFFTATQTFPRGDTTAWCAAFVNWCIARSGSSDSRTIGRSPRYFLEQGNPFSTELLEARTTLSAASGSFRCKDKLDKANEGDIVVFKKPGTDSETKYCRGQGHVAFLRTSASIEQSKIKVLGGNQGNAVSIATYPANSGLYKLHGFVAPP